MSLSSNFLIFKCVRNEILSLVNKLKREEGNVLSEKLEEDLIAFPQGKIYYLILVNPLKVAFITISCKLSCEFVRVEQMHVLGSKLV